MLSDGRHREGYSTYLYKEHAHKLEYKRLIKFVIHVNFDHAWEEHYPVTLICVTYDYYVPHAHVMTCIVNAYHGVRDIFAMEIINVLSCAYVGA